MSTTLSRLTDAASHLPELAIRGADIAARGAELAPDSLLASLGLQRRPTFGARLMGGVGFVSLAVVAGAGLAVGYQWFMGQSKTAKKARAQVRTMVDDVLEH